jgi:hypothetical protein
MVKPRFVGFQEQVEIPEGFELLEIHEVISGSKNRDQLFSLLSQPNLVSEWLYQVVDLNLKPGGGANFTGDDGNVFQAVCTAVDFGREISFLSDIFGDMSARIIKSENLFAIDIQFKILTDDVSAKSARIQQSLEKLRELSQ